jgi:hypothetical protein
LALIEQSQQARLLKYSPMLKEKDDTAAAAIAAVKTIEKKDEAEK